MRVTSYTITTDTPQVDGRFWVHVKFIFDTGLFTSENNYMANAGFDGMEEAAQVQMDAMNAEFERREQIEALANNYETPIRVDQFYDLFSSEAQVTIREAAKTNNTLANLIAYVEVKGFLTRTKTFEQLDNLAANSVISNATVSQVKSAWLALYGS